MATWTPKSKATEATMTKVQKTSATWTPLSVSATNLTFHVGDATGLTFAPPTYSVQQTFSGTVWTNTNKH